MEDTVHPTITQQLAKDIHQERLAQAARARLVRETRHRPGRTLIRRRLALTTQLILRRLAPDNPGFAEPGRTAKEQ